MASISKRAWNIPLDLILPGQCRIQRALRQRIGYLGTLSLVRVAPRSARHPSIYMRMLVWILYHCITIVLLTPSCSPDTVITRGGAAHDEGFNTHLCCGCR